MKAPYRAPATPAPGLDALTPSIAERLILTYRAARAVPRRWWRSLSTGTQVLFVIGLGMAAFLGFCLSITAMDPCRRHINAKVHGVTPEGLPADYDQSWCAEYKPGRAP